MRAPWPAADPQRVDVGVEEEFSTLREVVSELRRFRADHGLVPSTKLDVTAVTDPARRPVLERSLAGIRRLGGVASWDFAEQPPSADGPVGKVVVAEAELYIPLGGIIDLDEERERLQRELDRARGEIKRAEGKLTNRGFVDKAPAAVVQAERDKVADWQETAQKLTTQLEELR